MIRDYIQHLAEPKLREPGTESLMPCLATQLLIHALMVHNIVTVHAAWGRLQIWRTINVRNAEGAKIGSSIGSVIEREIRVQLKPVCRGENARHFLVAPTLAWDWKDRH
jgi:hypothetical protein